MSSNFRSKTSAIDAAPTEIPMLIGGEWRAAAETYAVRDPYRNVVVANAPRSSLVDLNDALDAAVKAKAKAAATPAYERAALLRRAAKLLVERADRIADDDVAGNRQGDQGRQGRDHAVAGYAVAVGRRGRAHRGRAHPARCERRWAPGKICFMLRFPVGVVAGITPFNAPVNLACHKIAPSIAAGNTLVLKAPPQSPGVIHELAQIFVDAGTPAGVLNVLYGDIVGPALVSDRPRRLHHLYRFAARRRADQGGVGIAPGRARTRRQRRHHRARRRRHRRGAPVCARNSMRLAGQSCISVQTVYVHRSLYDRFVELVVAEVKKLKLGDPLDPATDVGTLIDEAAASAWNPGSRKQRRRREGAHRRQAPRRPDRADRDHRRRSRT